MNLNVGHNSYPLIFKLVFILEYNVHILTNIYTLCFVIVFGIQLFFASAQFFLKPFQNFIIQVCNVEFVTHCLETITLLHSLMGKLITHCFVFCILLTKLFMGCVGIYGGWKLFITTTFSSAWFIRVIVLSKMHKM